MKKLFPLIFIPFAFLDLQGQKGSFEKERNDFLKSWLVDHEPIALFSPNENNKSVQGSAQRQYAPKRNSKEDKSPLLYFDDRSNSIASKPFLRISVDNGSDILVAQFPKQIGLISIYNIQYKLIYASKTDESGELKIDIGALEMGTYIVTFSNGKEFQASKFIKTF